MVEWTYSTYSLASWLIPTAMAVLTAIVLGILPEQPYLFVINRMLGINKCRSDEESSKAKASLGNPSNNTEANIEEEKTEVEVLEAKVDLRKNRLWRFFIWLLTALTISLFWIIIFDTIVLSTRSGNTGDKCPDFSADCFVFPDFRNFTPVGPYNCTPNNQADFAINGSMVCFAWVVRNQGMNDVINVLGTCGGFLGLVASIVPFVYYLSFNEKCYPWSISYGFIAAFISIAIIICLYVFKIGISILSWFVLLLTAALSLLASILAYVRLREKKNLSSSSWIVKMIKSLNTPKRPRNAVNTVSGQEQQSVGTPRVTQVWE